jgi:F-type H+-transporting ATPase subunit epsilon
MALLGNGQLRLGTAGGRNFNISGGFLQVLNNDVRVVTEEATPAS